MGERALASCRTARSRWWYHAQWGATRDRRRRVLTDGWGGINQLLDCGWRPRGKRSLSVCLSALDYCSYRALYLIRPDDVQLGVPVWLGVPGAGRPVPASVGVIVFPQTVPALTELEKRLARLRTHLGQALEADLLGLDTAIRLLCCALPNSRVHVPAAVAGFLQRIASFRRAEPPESSMTTVYITAPRETAQTLAQTLVEERLAACVNRVACESTYRWDGEVHEEPETILLAKTTADRYDQLRDRVLEVHPHDVPCIERFDEDAMLPAFADWREQASSG